MRPVRLDIAGFGSFREPATIDFTGVDYFAFVGATGAGKSTLIDAMAFALYGTVPRWNDKTRVSLALAPTATRGTVRLLFDVGDGRYVAARELRRAGDGKVTSPNARLERLADPNGIGAPDEITDVVGAGAAVRKEVEKLLGLTFDHFCTCVLLPQGEFAEFLRATPGDRQTLLTRLLGFSVYEEIRTAANSRAQEQRQRAGVLRERLAAYADATDAAEAEQTTRVETLTHLSSQVDETAAELVRLTTTATVSAQQLATQTAERDQLASVQAPTGLADLAERLRIADATHTEARQRRVQAEHADSSAREQLAAAGPRGPVEQQARDYQELADLLAERPAAVTAQAASITAREQADLRLEDAKRRLESATAAVAEAEGNATAADAEVTRLTAENDLLTGIRTPSGVAKLSDELRAAEDAYTAARAHRETAEQADSDARDQRSAAGDRGPLEQALRDHQTLTVLLNDHAAATKAHTSARSGQDAATAAADQAEAARQSAIEHKEVATRIDLAVALRPHLVAGDACPVCEQTVVTLPPTPADAGIAGAHETVAAAEREAAEQREVLAAARGVVMRTEVELAELSRRIEQTQGALAVVPKAAAAAALLAQIDDLDGAVKQADAKLRAARQGESTAEETATRLRDAAHKSRRDLNVARDPLVSLGAPALDDGDLAADWRTLVRWAANAASELAGRLATASDQAATAQRTLTGARQTQTQTAHEVEKLDTARNTAAQIEHGATAVLATIDGQINTLQAALADVPAADQIAATLANLDRLTTAAKQADGQLRAARTAADDAEQAQDRAKRDLTVVRAALGTARDSLVPLGAPVVDSENVLAGWTALTDWSRAQAAARDQQMTALSSEAETDRRRQEQAEAELHALLDVHSLHIESGSAVAVSARGAVAAGLAQARAELRRIVERRGEAAHLTEQIAAADEAGQVAHQLGLLLRSDRFTRWMVAAALDVLVDEASTTLAELSGGQFEFTHDNGEFFVIDHADADSRRPVRTLSGGETFQASLALALALSSQVSAMAASGAARLDALFLDEGFGSLDEATLDIVASTLESLASGGGRMIGLVTHVRALAERVPVRFLVNRDQRTSTVERESL